MKRENVREVKINLEETKTNNPIRYIGEEELRFVIKNIIEESKNEEGRLKYTSRDFKDIIYHLLIDYFKSHRLYFSGLTFKIIWKQVKALEGTFLYNDSKDLEGMYDELCWRKANGLIYDIKLFEELKEKYKNAGENNRRRFNRA